MNFWICFKSFVHDFVDVVPGLIFDRKDWHIIVYTVLCLGERERGMGSSTSLIFVLSSFVICFTNSLQTNVPTNHWKRCQGILMEHKMQPCIDNQDGPQKCFAVKRSNYEILSFFNSMNETGPSIGDLDVKYYTERLYESTNDTNYGVNVSFTVYKPEDHQQNAGGEFAVTAQFTEKHFFAARLSALLTDEDYVDGKATIYYDCVYPLMEEDIVMDLKVYGGNQILSSLLRTPLNNDFTQENEKHKAKPQQDTFTECIKGHFDQTSYIIVTIVLAACLVITLCGIIYLLNMIHHWKKTQDLIRVLLVYAEDNERHVFDCRRLCDRLTKTVPCQIHFISDICKSKTVRDKAMTCRYIIVVGCKTIKEALGGSNNLSEILSILQEQTCKTIMVYFTHTDLYDVTRDLSFTEPLPLDIGFPELVKCLKGEESILKNETPSTSNSTNSINVESQPDVDQQDTNDGHSSIQDNDIVSPLPGTDLVGRSGFWAAPESVLSWSQSKFSVGSFVSSINKPKW